MNNLIELSGTFEISQSSFFSHYPRANGRWSIPLRTAVYLVGVQRIAGAIGEQGTREYFRRLEKND